MESRKRVKDQLARIDSTYPEVDFYFVAADGIKRRVTTVEEEEFPQFYHLKPTLAPQELRDDDGVILSTTPGSTESENTAASPTKPIAIVTPIPELSEGHHVFPENRKGISYERLFGPYIDGASRIIVTDPYIRLFYQHRNLMEFAEMVIRRKKPEDQVAIHLVTGPDGVNTERQRELLDSITAACTGSGVDFSWAFDTSSAAHARDIVTDTGWKIVLDRGLDIFQPPIKTDGFSLGDRLQDHRTIKGFYVTYVRLKGDVQ